MCIYIHVSRYTDTYICIQIVIPFNFLFQIFGKPDSPMLYESQQLAFCCLSCELLVGDVFRISPRTLTCRGSCPHTKSPKCPAASVLMGCPVLPTPGPQADVTFSPCEWAVGPHPLAARPSTFWTTHPRPRLYSKLESHCTHGDTCLHVSLLTCLLYYQLPVLRHTHT